MLRSVSGWTAAGLHYGRGLSPVAAMLALLRPDWGDFNGRAHSLMSLWSTFLVSATAVIVGCAIFLAIRLSRPNWDERSEKVETQNQPLWRRLLLRKATSKVRSAIWTVNPLYINEGRINAARSGVWCVRLFYFSVFTSMVLAALISLFGGGGDPELLNHATQIVIAFQIGVIAVDYAGADQRGNQQRKRDGDI